MKIKKIPLKIEITTASTHDSTTLLPVVDKIIAEHPEVHMGNLNADSGYLSDDNSDDLNERKIFNSVTHVKRVLEKFLKEDKIKGNVLRVFSLSLSNVLDYKTPGFMDYQK